MRPQGATEPEPYAREAKEFVRATCIGAQCTVTLEYTRKVPPPLDSNAAARAAEVNLQFGNIEVPTKRGPQQLAEMVVRRGFAALQVRTVCIDEVALRRALVADYQHTITRSTCRCTDRGLEMCMWGRHCTCLPNRKYQGKSPEHNHVMHTKHPFTPE